MDDLMSKIQSMLSDKESMEQIKQLADMLGAGASTAPAQNAAPKSTGGTPDLSALLAGLTGGNTGGNSGAQTSGGDGGLGGLGGLDMGMLLQLQSLFSSAASGDKNSELLLALKPHLKEDKQEKVDKAIKILKLMALWTVVKESGLLNSLDLL